MKKRFITLKVIVLMLFVSLFLSLFNCTFADGHTKTMTIEFEEQLDGQNRSKTVTIPHLKNVVSVTTNTGNVTHSISGDNVTVNVSGGSTNKSVNNSNKYSKQVTDYLTSSSDSFSDTKSFNKDDYKGVLSKDGESIKETVYIEEKRGGGGYYETQTVPGYYEDVWLDSYEEEECTYPYMNWDSVIDPGGKSIITGPSKQKVCHMKTIPGHYIQKYIPPSEKKVWVDNPDWYEKVPVITYKQSYSGNVYKAGVDNYYKYIVNIEYIDNSNPVLSISTPVSTRYINNKGNFTLSGTVTDIDDNQKVTVSATINGVEKTKILTSPVSNVVWSLTWNSFELSEGDYSNVEIMVTDDEGGFDSKNYEGTLIVDKTPPIININPYTLIPTKNDIIVIASVDDGKLNSTSHRFSENGSFIFEAYDLAGNKSSKEIVINNIDREKPFISIDNEYIDDNDFKIVNMSKEDKKIVNVFVEDKGTAGIDYVRYFVSKQQSKPSDSDWIGLSLYESKGVINIDSDNIGDNYVHVEAYDNAGNVTYVYKGNYRINDPVVISNLRIIEGDPGVIQIDGNEKIKVQGKDAYVLKKNNFKNNYVVDIKNADKDKVRAYYSVKNIDNGKEVYKGESDVEQNSKEHKISINYFSKDLLDNWEDGVYEVTVRCVDYEGTVPDNDFMSEDTQEVYILIKENAPPKPIIKVKEVDGGKEVSIEYPQEPSNKFNDPSISGYYKKEYQRTSAEGIKPYSEVLKVKRNETIVAIYTDIVGNVSKGVVNVVVGGNTSGGNTSGGNISGEDIPFVGFPAKVEEGRVTNSYYINTRKEVDGEANKNKLSFINNF